jgi:hypothetical protein
LTESRPVLHVLTERELERERLRGIFAIGAIALLYYLRQAIGGGKPLVLAEIHPILLGTVLLQLPTFTISSDLIMQLWGVYVIGVAIALADQYVYADRVYSKIARLSFTVAYGAAQIAYVFGVALLILTGVIWLAPLVVTIFLFYILEQVGKHVSHAIGQAKISATASVTAGAPPNDE